MIVLIKVYTKDDDNETTATNDANIRVAPPNYANNNTNNEKKKKNTNYKFTTHVLYRSVKPISGIFFGLPKSRLFKRELDRLIQNDMTGRNCGPSIIIRRAIKNIPSLNEVLDEPFIKTEDLYETNPSYVGRSNRDYITDCCQATTTNNNDNNINNNNNNRRQGKK